MLQEIGLTQGEIKTYLALLKTGSSSTGLIAKESQVSRSKLYSILDKLEKKGLVSHTDKNGVIYFQAAEPSKIRDYIKEEEEKLRRIDEDFQKFLPQLEMFAKEAGRVQKVSVYQGLKGLLTAHSHVYLKLKKGETFNYMGVPKDQPESHHREWHKDHLLRIKKGINCRLLFNSDTSRTILENRNSYKGSNARYMPTDMKTPSYFLVYKDTLMIAIPSESPLAIEIISQEIADSFMAYFEEYWKRSKPFK